MTRDFTLHTYREFLMMLLQNGYELLSYKEYLRKLPSRFMILRQDVDKRPEQALRVAHIQHELNVSGTYYFRVVPGSFDEEIMRKIKDMGHEIGYHYEDLSIARGNKQKAIRHFEHWLEKFREIYPVETICMHGSPLSPWDNREIWRSGEGVDYRDYGIRAEPYFDLDFDEVFYLTDTGRRWDGASVSMRDKVKSGFNRSYSTTFEIMQALRKGDFPEKVLQNIHPQRWTDDRVLWWKEFFLQRMKNVVKRTLLTKKALNNQ